VLKGGKSLEDKNECRSPITIDIEPPVGPRYFSWTGAIESWSTVSAIQLIHHRRKYNVGRGYHLSKPLNRLL